MFKVGDKVVFYKEGCIGWESINYTSHLKLNKNYIVSQVNSGDNTECVKILGDDYWFHIKHFKLAGISNPNSDIIIKQ